MSLDLHKSERKAGGIRVGNSLAVPGAGFAVRNPLAFADRCA